MRLFCCAAVLLAVVGCAGGSTSSTPASAGSGAQVSPQAPTRLGSGGEGQAGAAAVGGPQAVQKVADQ